MADPRVTAEAWIKVICYEDGTVKTVQYPDHRTEPKMDPDDPPSIMNGGLTSNEQYATPKQQDSGVFNKMYKKLYED